MRSGVSNCALVKQSRGRGRISKCSAIRSSPRTIQPSMHLAKCPSQAILTNDLVRGEFWRDVKLPNFYCRFIGIKYTLFDFSTWTFLCFTFERMDRTGLHALASGFDDPIHSCDQLGTTWYETRAADFDILSASEPSRSRTYPR